MNLARTRFLGLSTSDARSVANGLAPAFGAVNVVLNELNAGTTPSSDEIDASITAASQINDAIQNLAGQDGPGAYAASTSAILQALPAVQLLLYTEQTSIAQHAGTGFVAPPDPTMLANAVAGWAVVQSNTAGITTTANAIDAGISSSSSQASAGAAAQAAAAAAAAGGGSPTGGGGTLAPPVVAPPPAGGSSSTSTSTSGSTVVTPPPATPPVVPPSTTTPAPVVHAPGSPAALVASITPAAWVFIGLGSLLVLGVWAGYVDVPKPVAQAIGMKSGAPARKKNPRRRARRRSRA
jgi:molecular chaperone DnaK